MDTTPQDGPQCGDANGARRTNAKVVGIIRRSWRSRGYAGHLCVASDSVHGAGPKSLLFQPVDRRLPRVRISTRQAATLADKRIVVVIDSWAADSPFPNGHYVRTLGKLGDREAETEAVLLEHDINTAPFTRAVHACVPALPWAVDPGVDLAPGPMFTRQDLRDLDVCSVDPPGCKDIDDALHVRRLPSDADHPHERIEVGVHIADVTHFVREGTPIDEEAAARSTTTYLVERRIDMLPKALTEEICSLKPNVDRLAFSVLWEMTPEGEPLRQPRFCKSVIRSRAALTYVEAQMRIDGTDKAGDDAITDSLRLMNQVAKSLRRKRFAAGALELASPEVKFEIDTETHNPTDVGVYHLHDTNRMVEEMMLLANIAVANRILKGFPGSAVLRRHPHPTASLFAPLVAATAAAGFDIDVKTSKSVAKSLDQCVRSDDPYFNRLVRIMATRCMTQAVYCSSAEVASQDLHHYGLATPLYTHFTSPIRRYADCLVHRLLAACEGLGPAPARLGDRGWMRGVVNNMNERHRNAQLAGRASVELYTLMFFHGRPTKEIGRVVRVRANGLIVLVPKYGIEGPVYFYRKGEEASPWKLDEGGQRATDPTGVRSYQVFDQVPVTISVREDARGLRELMLALRDEA
ncbi:unnamed protein product [Pedinophyceae sp. YPF-701]|nr:unnamed protein product [Pedinophyceae sp. YPF-701]